METPEEYQEKMKNRVGLVDRIHDLFICEIHNKTIFNCVVTSDYVIHYETCCKDFSEIVEKEMNKCPL